MPIMFPRKILQRNLSPTDTPTDGQNLTFDNATQLWLASDAAGSTFAKVVKSADQTVNNSSTLQDDDELLAALNINKTYCFVLIVYVISPSNADIKKAFTIPTGATGTLSSGTWSQILGGTIDITSSRNDDSNGTTQFFMLNGRVIMSTTAGNLVFQWAQNTAQVADTKFLQGSTLLVWEED